jgi:hypothetical protein
MSQPKDAGRAASKAGAEPRGSRWTAAGIRSTTGTAAEGAASTPGWAEAMLGGGEPWSAWDGPRTGPARTDAVAAGRHAGWVRRRELHVASMTYRLRGCSA